METNQFWDGHFHNFLISAWSLQILGLNKENTIVQQLGSENIYVSSERDITLQKQLSSALGPQGPNHYIFGNQFYSEKCKKAQIPCIPLFSC